MKLYAAASHVTRVTLVGAALYSNSIRTLWATTIARGAQHRKHTREPLRCAVTVSMQLRAPKERT